MQLWLAEDARDGAREELREGKEARERRQQELRETRRALGGESRDKGTLQRSNAELRAAVTQTQSERSSLQRGLEEKQQEAAVLGEAKAAGELRTSLREVEKSRVQPLRELRRQGAGRVQALNLSRRLKEMERVREQSSRRILLAAAEEGQRGVAGHPSSAQTALALQEETARRAGQKHQALEEHAASLEHSLRAGQHKTRELQEKAHLEAPEKRRPQGALEAAESRAATPERSHGSVEGELQCVRLRLVEQDTEIQALRRQLGQSESQAAELRQALAQLEGGGRRRKGEVRSLSRAQADTSAGSSALQENVSQLQKALTAAEQDRRVLQEQLDIMRQTLSDSKRRNHSLMDAARELRYQLGELEQRCRELEAQVEHLQERVCQQQRSQQEAAAALQSGREERLTMLQRAMAHLQGENKALERSALRLKQENAALKKTLSKTSH